MSAKQTVRIGSAICSLMAGCGDQSTGPTNSETGSIVACLESSCAGEPCGGDPVGTWELVCLSIPEKGPFLCEGTLTYDEYCAQLTLIFDPDGWGVSVLGSAEFTGAGFVPSDCLGASSCQELSEELSQGKDFELNCQETDEGCDCDVAASFEGPLTSAWTYLTDGDVLHLTEDAGPSDFEFCADETSLWLGGQDISYTLRRQ